MTALFQKALTGQSEAAYDENTFYDRVVDIAERYNIRPIGYQLLVAMWIRPKETKTKGGLILTDKTLDEDKWQGKVGQVIGLGPDAYRSDQYRTFSSEWCHDGDWVIVPKSEHVSRMLEVEGFIFCFLNDDRILGKIGVPVAV